VIVDRWCRKYIGDEGVRSEIKILDRSYKFLLTLSKEPLSNIFPLYIE